MERFVVRGSAAAALATDGEGDGDGRTQHKALGKRRHRQTTIDVGGKVVVEEMVFHLRDELDAAKTPAEMCTVLEALEQHFVSLEMLEKTLIGRALTKLQRRAPTEEIQVRAAQLLKTWKARAKKAARRRKRRVEMYGRNFAD